MFGKQVNPYEEVIGQSCTLAGPSDSLWTLSSQLRICADLFHIIDWKNRIGLGPISTDLVLSTRLACNHFIIHHFIHLTPPLLTTYRFCSQSHRLKPD